MSSFFVQALWLSSLVSAQQVITITEYRKCSTSAAFSALPATTPTYNSTQEPTLPASLSSSSPSSSVSPPRGPGLGATGPGAAGPGVLSPTAQQNVDYLFWLNYGRAIMKAASIQPSGNNAFFIGSATQKGPVAGSNIPEEYTNLGLHAIANGLLNDSSPFYNPTAEYGYIEALRDYLDYVDLEGNPTPAQEEALLEAQQDIAAAHTRSRSEQAIAFQDFTDDETMGLTNGMTFAQWLESGKAPAYTAAILREQQIGAQLESIQNDIAGPKAAPKARDRVAVNKGFSDTAFPGYNMDAAVGKLSSPRELLNCFNNKVPCPTPSTFKVPLFSAPRYKAFVQEAQVESGRKYEPAQSTTFMIDTGESSSDFQFGQESVGANASPGGWFSFWSASASRETESSTLRTGSAASSVSIKIVYDAIEAIDVTPGLWNFNPKQYRLLDTAPKSLGQLYRPSQLVVARRLGYNITVNDALAKSLDTHFKETTKVSGGFRIFGISIGASYSKTDIRNTHEASFDSATNTVVVVPKDDTGVATLVGVVGERFAVLGA